MTNSIVPYNENIYLILPDNSFVPVEISAVSFGQRGHITLRTANGQHYQIISLTENLRQEFERVVSNMTRRTVADVMRREHISKYELPQELAEPETAWPYLAERFPWLFNEIDTSREPYAHYLRKSPKSQQIRAEALDLSQLGDNPSLADISEVVYGSRYYSGSQYKTLKKLQSELNSSSSDSQNAGSDASERVKKAA